MRRPGAIVGPATYFPRVASRGVLIALITATSSSSCIADTSVHEHRSTGLQVYRLNGYNLLCFVNINVLTISLSFSAPILHCLLSCQDSTVGLSKLCLMLLIMQKEVYFSFQNYFLDFLKIMSDAVTSFSIDDLPCLKTLCHP